MVVAEKLEDWEFIQLVEQTSPYEAAKTLGIAYQTVFQRYGRLERKRALSLLQQVIDWVDDDEQCFPSAVLIGEIRLLLKGRNNQDD